MPSSGNLSRLRLPRSTDAPTLNSESAIPLLALLEAQGDVIDNMANGAGLRETLTEIALLIERVAPPALCSILLLQHDGRHLRPAAAPSLPETFREAINSIEIGPCAGSCGTAAYRKEPVIVTDIATDPLWAGPRDFTLSCGLRACWSMPIIRRDGLVLGTIAMYYREPRAPTAGDWGWLEPASKLVRLALAQSRREEELRESEARWTLAAEAAGLGTYDVDVHTNHDIWSDQFKTILGIDSSSKPSLDLLISLVHPEDRERFVKSFGPEADYNVYRNEEFRIRRVDDGEERVVVLKGRILTNGEGMPNRAIGTLADITEQRQQETALTQAKIAAEQANRAKSAFLASMSHELRTPLNAVLGFSDLMRQETWGPITPPKYREYIEDIHSSGRHLLSLINDVLDMAKIEAGKREFQISEIDLAGVAHNALRFIEPQANERGLTLEPLIQGGIGLMADERAVLQILTNLLSNAVKFTKRGGRISVFARLAPGGSVSIGVKDTGIGMTVEGIKRALEPFGQIDPTITNEGKGTGLGLPITKALIEAHGASFHIESAVGKGTRVWGIFPPDLVVAQAR